MMSTLSDTAKNSLLTGSGRIARKTWEKDDKYLVVPTNTMNFLVCVHKLGSNPWVPSYEDLVATDWSILK